MAIELVEPENAVEMDPIEAVFADGSKMAVFGVTVKDIRNWQLGRARHAEVEEIWSGEHKTTHHTLLVKPRCDRGLLMSLYEQDRQVLQVHVDRFAKQDEEEEGPEARKRAGEFMSKIAIDYSEGKCEREQFAKLRDEELKKLGIDGRRTKRKEADKNNEATSLKEELEALAGEGKSVGPELDNETVKKGKELGSSSTRISTKRSSNNSGTKAMK